jgi:hypothetical protein
MYEAAVLPDSGPRIEQVRLPGLAERKVRSIPILCIPPADPTVYDDGMIDKLGLN